MHEIHIFSFCMKYINYPYDNVILIVMKKRFHTKEFQPIHRTLIIQARFICLKQNRRESMRTNTKMNDKKKKTKINRFSIASVLIND